MIILKRDEISEDLYLKTWELDNNTFEGTDLIEKDKALEWFYSSGKRIIIAYDEIKKEVMGYIFYFLLKPSFSARYINTSKSFQLISSKDFITDGAKKADIYLFSTVIKKEYRDIKIDKETLFKKLNNEFFKDIVELVSSGLQINYVYAEAVTKDGEKYLESLQMNPCFYYANDCKYVKKFSLDMFKNCSNYNELLKYYELNCCKNITIKPNLLNHEYLEVKDNNLYYKNVNLYELVKKYNSPLEVAYLDIIPEKIKQLKEYFNNSINKYNYNGKYNYAYATKANYYCEVVSTVSKNVNFLETSSAYDISIIKELLDKKVIDDTYTIICNGFKNKKYVENIKILLEKNVKVIPIIENADELKSFSELDFNIDVGLRYNSDFDARLIKNNFKDEDEFNNRFGFEEQEIYSMAKKIKEIPNMTLKVLHFHFGGVISNIDNYIKGYSNIFKIYCKLKKKYKELQYFDFGGGLPVKYELGYTFNYEDLIDRIIQKSKEIADLNNIKHPDLIGEHGRYTVADHSFFIYKVDFTKQYYNDKWYVLNTSIMNMTPDAWAINQKFTILPINMWDREFNSVLIGGETCDPDDRYFINNKNIELAMPEINSNEELYIAIFSVGAYQENISGIGGVHHCMIPEGIEVIIYDNGKSMLKINDIQTEEEMLEILGYKDRRIYDIIKE